MTHQNTAYYEVFVHGFDHRHCEQLQSLNAKNRIMLSPFKYPFLIIVSNEWDTCPVHNELSFLLLLLDLSQPQPAEQVFNVYLREGHQFSVHTYNKLLLGWATQVKLILVFPGPSLL